MKAEIEGRGVSWPVVYDFQGGEVRGNQNGFGGESDADLWCFVFVGFFYKKGTKLERLQLKCKKSRRDFFENRKRKRARQTESERENGNVTVDAQRIRVDHGLF